MKTRDGVEYVEGMDLYYLYHCGNGAYQIMEILGSSKMTAPLLKTYYASRQVVIKTYYASRKAAIEEILSRLRNFQISIHGMTEQWKRELEEIPQ